ncbi:RAP domain-containing protein [Pycnococcus provasolii]
MLVRGRTDDGGERLLAIECDGPVHFFRASDGTYRIDGSTYARNCHLRKLGLDVLCVACHEWTNLKRDERDAYLRRELLHKRDFKHSFKRDDATRPTRDEVLSRLAAAGESWAGGRHRRGGGAARGVAGSPVQAPQASASASSSYVPPPHSSSSYSAAALSDFKRDDASPTPQASASAYVPPHRFSYSAALRSKRC